MPKYTPRGPRTPLGQGRNGSRSINAALLQKAGGDDNVGATAAPVNAVAASRLLTSDATAPSNGETVTLAGLVYTFKTALTAAARDVLIGVSAAVALDNLKSAVNRTGVPGTDYSAATVVHPTIEATTNTDTTQLFVARTKGVAGNALTVVEGSAHLSFPSGTLTGGVNGTEGEAGESIFYGGYQYYTPTKNTIHDANWLKSAQFTAA